jgi:iron complex outermembrane recepter protein
MPYTRWLFALLLAMAALAPTAHAQANRNFTLELPAQPLGESLTQLATQTGVQIVFFSEVTQGLQAPPLSGDYTPGEAVNQLLTGTDLVALQMDDNGSIAVQRQPPAMADEFTFDIPAQSMAGAVQAFERLTGLPITYSAGLLDGLTAKAVQGSMSVAAALAALFDGTGVEYAPNGNGGVTLNPVNANVDFGTGGSGTASVETARRGGVEEIIVTGQKKAERLQDVPIAISAFDMESLDAQKLEGGFDLLKAIPNVTFSKTNFTGYNFQIRGIGTQAISATTDPGVAVSFNNTTLIVNRLFEQEYLDIERVEVLRGPQGTLYGRNATAGVINVISAKPEMGVYAGELKMEIGNYQAQRLRGHFNMPFGESWALRGAYSMTQREGFGFNEFNGADVDDRDLWTGRLTLGWQPNDRVRANLLWERFEEDDQRVRTSKQLCHHDPGPSQVRSADVTQALAVTRALLSQSCVGGSLYDRGEPGLHPDDPAGVAHGAFGTPNGAALPFVSALYWGPRTGALDLFVGGGVGHLGMNPYVDHRLGNQPTGILIHAADPNPPCEAETIFRGVTPLNLCNPDPYRARGQSRDLRTISSVLTPEYEAEADVFEFSIDVDLSDDLKLASQTVYVRDELFTTQDFNRFQSFPLFNNSDTTCGYGVVAVEIAPGFSIDVPGPDCSNDPVQGRGTFPGVMLPGQDRTILSGGVYCDPQLGCSDLLVAQDISQSQSKQFNQEFRLQSDFTGDWNFSLGANYTQFSTRNDYFVFANTLTLLTHFFPFNFYGTLGQDSVCVREDEQCTFIDPKPLREVAANPEGHNFFLSANPYELRSQGVFGELYWQATDTVKVTLGARVSWDRKTFTPVPSQLLLSDYRDFDFIAAGDGPETCTQTAGNCELAGNALGGRGYPASPALVQEWREPTGRLVVDWKPDVGWTDETLLYASLSRGYKGGGANPPSIAPPAGLINAANSGAEVPPTFKPEYVNALEIGTKNTLLDGGLTLNGNVFFYDYSDYQVSKILNRSAANENFDVRIWGAELEAMFAPSVDWQFNAVLGYLNTRVANGEKSLDLMDRTQGGNQVFDLDTPIIITTPDAQGNLQTIEHHQIDEWLVFKPWIVNSSNCIAPAVVVEAVLNNVVSENDNAALLGFCPGGNVFSGGFGGTVSGDAGQVRFANGTEIYYDPRTQAPNRGQGFFADLSGNDLPNAPHWTAAVGAQRNVELPQGWLATLRVDHYWQAASYHRIYNTEYDRLRAWSNTNFSLWVTQPQIGVTIEAYVKNAFDETPITGAFLNSDDSGLTTNVFTLDPRLIGLSIRKTF